MLILLAESALRIQFGYGKFYSLVVKINNENIFIRRKGEILPWIEPIFREKDILFYFVSMSFPMVTGTSTSNKLGWRWHGRRELN